MIKVSSGAGVSTNPGADCRCARSAVGEEIVEVCDFSWSASNIAQLRIVDVPVPLFLEQTAEVIKVILQ